MRKISKSTLAWLCLGVALVGALWFMASHTLNLEEIKRIGQNLSEFQASHRNVIFVSMVTAQVVGMSLSLPTKAVLTLLSGAMLGTLLGSAATLIGVLAGTSILFFVTRRLFQKRAQKRLGDLAKKIETRISQRPIRAMIGLRLFITLPYGPITLAAALSTIRFRDFLIGSLVGDTPVVVLYTIAGQQLFALTSVSEALSPITVGILVGIGIIFLVGALGGRRRTGLNKV